MRPNVPGYPNASRSASRRQRGGFDPNAPTAEGAPPPAFAEDAEIAVIGSIFADPGAFEEVRWLAPEDFYLEPHRAIWRAITYCADHDNLPDVVSVAEALRRAGEESEATTSALLNAERHIFSAAGINQFARIVKNRSAARAIQAIAAEVAIQARTCDEPTLLLAETETRMRAVGESLVHMRDDEPWSESVKRVAIQIVEEYMAPEDNATGLRTGFDELDEITRPWKPGELIICGARPAMGKSALALQIAMHTASLTPEQGGGPVIFFSLEMPREQLMRRAIHSEARVPNHFRQTSDHDPRFDRIIRASKAVGALKMDVNDNSTHTAHTLSAFARRTKSKTGLALVVVDYLQLISAVDTRAPRQVQISEASRALKILARDLEVPVLALAQLSRELEKRSDKRPIMSDLRESGSMEQDADKVLMIYRDDYYNKEKSEDRGTAEVIVVKNRGGSTGTARLNFNAEITRFS